MPAGMAWTGIWPLATNCTPDRRTTVANVRPYLFTPGGHSSSDADPMPVGMRNACLRRLAAEQTDRCRGLHCIVT
jgi:hypothetical protein